MQAAGAGGDRYAQGNAPQSMDDMGNAGMNGGGYGASNGSPSNGGMPPQQNYSQPHSAGNMEPSFTEDDIPF